MRNYMVIALALALAACGGSDEPTPLETTEVDGYEVPGGISFPEDVDITSSTSQTLDGKQLVGFRFTTALSTEELLSFFADKNMPLAKKQDDANELYVGNLADGTELKLKFDKLPAGESGETIYNLRVVSAVRR
jgi:hypothetical protein